MTGEEVKDWTISKLIGWSTSYLSDNGIDDSRISAELILAHILDLRRVDLYMRHDMILPSGDLGRYRLLLDRRARHEPVQYILGWTEFMGLRFDLNNSVLIPRPETEILVESVVSAYKGKSEDGLSVLDLGTGSGCIAITLAKMLPGSTVSGVDISKDALEIAWMNGIKLGVNQALSWFQMDIMDEPELDGNYDLIVSNPPYIPLEEVATLQPEVRIYEPRLAYTDFGDGTSFFRRISELGGTLLKKSGSIFMEVGYDQAELVRKILLEDDYSRVDMIKDYDGIYRVVCGIRA